MISTVNADAQRTIAEMRFAFTLLCLMLICSSCAAPNAVLKPPEPVAGLKPATERATYSAEQLIQIDLATNGFGDWYLARLAAACDALARDAANPDARFEALRLKATQASSIYAILTGPNPIVQTLDLNVLVELTYLKWAGEGKAVVAFGDQGKLLVDALAEVRERCRSFAMRVVSTGELDAISQSVQSWRNRNLEINDIEFIRFDDFAVELARSLSPQAHGDLMSSLQDAAARLSETRLLGERALFLTSRFPRIMRWQFEALMGDLGRQTEARNAVAGLTQLTHTAAELTRDAARLQESLDSHPQKMVELLTSAPVMKQALSTANEAVLRAETVTKQLAAVESSIQALDGAISSLTRQFDQLNRACDPVLLQQLAHEAKVAAVQEVRSLIYLISGCLVGLVVLHALLRRWSAPRSGHR